MITVVAITLLSILILSSMIHHESESMHDKYGLGKNDILNQRFESPTKPRKQTFGMCTIRKGVAPNHPIQSTFTASYPGSGAKMTWKLIEAMTGLITGDDFGLNGQENVVSIKTHYPSSEGTLFDGADNIPRAILLIRNPLHSIPSYFNFLYEYENNLPGHSTKAPLEEWVKWRNANLDRQIQVWRRHTEYWMDTYDKSNRLVTSYEGMTSDDLGAVEAMKIAEFLNRSEGVNLVPPEDVPCVWHTVVKYKKRRRLQEKEKVLRKETYIYYPNTKRGLTQEDEKSPDDSSTIKEVQGYSPPYYSHIQVEEQALSKQQNEKEVPHYVAPYTSQNEENVPNDQQTTSEVPAYEAPSYYQMSKNNEDSKNEGPHVLHHSNDQERIPYDPKKKMFAPNYAATHDPQNESGKPNISDDSEEKEKTSQDPQDKEKTIEKPSYNMKKDEETVVETPSYYTKQDKVTAVDKPSYYTKQVKETKIETPLHITQDRMKSLDDPQSKRGGPKYIAPYNPRQLRDLINMLTELLERYRDDKDLAPILVSYIDEAARRSRGPSEDEHTVVVIET
jgi:hypothetical protein